MVSIPDFRLAFQDGAVMPIGGSSVEARIVRHHLGELHLPSGRVVACDPGFGEERAFVMALNPGRYSVILSIADWKRDRRVVCAMIQVNASTSQTWKQAGLPGLQADIDTDANVPVAWEIARREGDKPGERLGGYGVDSATGCFMDAETAAIWRQKLDEPDFWEKAIDQMEELDGGTTQWGNIIVPTPEGQVNAVMFSTGYGDGFYASYWGYTADGQIACLVTDFGVLKGTIAL